MEMVFSDPNNPLNQGIVDISDMTLDEIHEAIITQSDIMGRSEVTPKED